MLSRLKSTLNSFRLGWKQDKILKLCEQKKYDKLAETLKNQKDYNQMMIDEYPFIYYLINAKQSNGVDTLLQKLSYKSDILNDDKNPMNIFPIGYAFLEGDQEMVDVIQKNGGVLNKVNKFGQNILHLAAIYKRQQAFKKGIAKGIDINFADQYGNTPFHYAARAGNPQMVKCLISGRARRTQNKLYQYPIHMAIQSTNMETFDLLQNDVNGVYQKYHPIHSASRSGNSQMITRVLKMKPSCLNIKDYQGLTPLHHAVLVEHIDGIRTLVKQNGILVNLTDEYGNTPLHLAMMTANLDASKILIENKGDLDLENQDFLSPADYGISSQSKDLHSLLISNRQKSKKVQTWSNNKY